VLPNLEHILVKRPDAVFTVEMGGRPFIKVKFVIKHLRIEKRLNWYSNFDESRHIFVEQETRHEVVLVFHDVLYDYLYGSHLVASESRVNR